MKKYLYFISLIFIYSLINFSIVTVSSLDYGENQGEDIYYSDTFNFIIPELITKNELTLLDLSQVTKIALHHMQNSTAGFDGIQSWHLERGFDAIGYNFWVDFAGNVYVGRGFNKGAAVAKQNDYIISIGFQGNYQSPKSCMPDAQFNTGVALVKWIKERVPTVCQVGGHGDFGQTDCPGKYFPLDKMVSAIEHADHSVNKDIP